jgi:general stress protein CsbA
MYLVSLNIGEQKWEDFTYLDFQNEMTPPSQTYRGFLVMLGIPVLLIASFILLGWAGFWIIGVLVVSIIVTRMIMPKNQDMYTAKIIEHLSTKKIKYSHVPEFVDTLESIKKMISGYISHSDCRNIAVNKLKKLL